MSVCLCRAGEDCRRAKNKKRRNRFIHSVRNTSECEMEIRKKKRRRRADLMLDSAFRFLRFYFCTCTFEYYQLQSKYPPRIPHKCRCIKRHNECNTTAAVVWFVKQAMVHIFSPQTDASHDTDTGKTSALYPIRSVQENMKTHQWNSNSVVVKQFSQHACT